jgi:hypothetical protein
MKDLVAVKQNSQGMSFSCSMASCQPLIPLCPDSPPGITPFWREVWRDTPMALTDRLLSRHFGAKFGAIRR